MAYDSNRLLNVVFVLDTTVSMTRRFPDSQTRILDEMNKTVEKFLKEIIEDEKLCEITKVAFITFSDGVTMETGFYHIKNLNQDCFKPLSDQYVQKVNMKNVFVTPAGGKGDAINVPVFEAIGEPTYSRVGSGVIRALEKLDEEHASIDKQLEGQKNTGTRPYVPVMVLISDGAPDERDVNGKLCPTADPEEEKRAKSMIRNRCYSTAGNATKLVIPVICAIGDKEVREQMEGYCDYSLGYLDGFQFINLDHRGKGFQELIVKLGQSLTRSISLADEKKKEKQNKAATGPKKKYNGKKETYRGPSEEEDLDGDEDLKRTGR